MEVSYKVRGVTRDKGNMLVTANSDRAGVEIILSIPETLGVQGGNIIALHTTRVADVFNLVRFSKGDKGCQHLCAVLKESPNKYSYARMTPQV